MPLPSVGAVWVCRTVTCAVESVTPRLFWPPAAMPAYCFVQPVVACENGLSTAKTITALGLKPNKIVREAAPVPVYVRTSVGVSKRFLRVSFKCQFSFRSLLMRISNSIMTKNDFVLRISDEKLRYFDLCVCEKDFRYCRGVIPVFFRNSFKKFPRL